MTRPSPNDVAAELHNRGNGTVTHRLAAVQPAEGTKLDENTWVWVQCFADFDFEYAYLVDVRWSVDGVTTSDYLAMFVGYDRHGVRVSRATWWRQPVVFPEVPNLYDALSWWATWVKDTRGGEHGTSEAG